MSLLHVSPATFLSLFLSSRTRKRLEPLFASAHDVQPLSSSARLLYLTSAPLGGERPCDAVVYQDHFADGGVVRGVRDGRHAPGRAAHRLAPAPRPSAVH